MIDWIECPVCLTEYKLISKEPQVEVEFCPFCGIDVQNQFTPEEIDDEDEEFDT